MLLSHKLLPVVVAIIAIALTAGGIIDRYTTQRIGLFVAAGITCLLSIALSWFIM